MATALTVVNGPKLKVTQEPAERTDFGSYPKLERRKLTWSGRLGGQKFEVTASMRERPYWVGVGRNANRWAQGHMSQSDRSYRAKPKIFVWFKDESIFDNFANRESRPVALMGKATRQLLKQLGLGGKIGWSQKAGCSMCPCSPGFIWGDAPALDFGDGNVTTLYDFSVTIDGMPQVELTERALARQRQRALALINDPTIDALALAGTR